jgi:hypothetical protein
MMIVGATRFERFGRSDIWLLHTLKTLILLSVSLSLIVIGVQISAAQSTPNLDDMTTKSSAPTGPTPVTMNVPHRSQTVETTSIDGHTLLSQQNLDPRNASPEMFELMHRERRWAIDETQFLHERLVSLASQSHQPPNPIPTISEADYATKLAELETKIREDERVHLDQTLQERQRVAAQLELVDLTRQKARLDLNLSESRAFRQADADQSALRQAEAETSKQYQDAQHYLLSIDDTINGLLLNTESANNFRLLIGLVFAGLVALIIGGFYIIAWKEIALKKHFYPMIVGFNL